MGCMCCHSAWRERLAPDRQWFPFVASEGESSREISFPQACTSENCAHFIAISVTCCRSSSVYILYDGRQGITVLGERSVTVNQILS